MIHPEDGMQYYSATQCNKLMILATQWMDPKRILLSERSHSKGYIQYDSKYATFWKVKTMKETKQWLAGTGHEGSAGYEGHPSYTSSNYKM